MTEVEIFPDLNRQTGMSVQWMTLRLGSFYMSGTELGVMRLGLRLDNSGSYGSPALTRLIVCLSVVCLSVTVAYGVKLFCLTTNFPEIFCGGRSREKLFLVLSKDLD